MMMTQPALFSSFRSLLPLSSSTNNFCKLLRIHKIVSYLTRPFLVFIVCAQHLCDFACFCKLAEIHSQYFWGWSGVWLSLCCLYGLASNHPTNQPSNLKGSDSLNPPPLPPSLKVISQNSAIQNQIFICVLSDMWVTLEQSPNKFIHS